MISKAYVVFMATMVGGCGCEGGPETVEYERPLVRVDIVAEEPLVLAAVHHTKAECRPPVQSYGDCELHRCQLQTDCSSSAVEVTLSDGVTTQSVRSDADMVTGLGGLDISGALEVTGEDPAFATSVTMPPEALALQSPAATASLSRGADMTITWEPGIDGAEVFVTLADGEEVAFCPALICRFDAAAGTGVVPGEALERLSDTQIRWWASIEDRAELEASGFDIVVTAKHNGAAGDRRDLTFE